MKLLAKWRNWAPNACAEERATLCDLRIIISGENACLFDADDLDEPGEEELTVPAVHLATGLATDWWSIFGGRDDKGHSIQYYRTGYALPDVNFKFDGSVFEVSANTLTLENPDLQFRGIGKPEEISRTEAESVLSGFIERVIERLGKKGVNRTEVALSWSHVLESRQDPDEQIFCEAAGALGIDPYLISDEDASFIEQAGELFSGETLIEFLAGIKGAHGMGKDLGWIRRIEASAKKRSHLPELHAVASQIGSELAHHRRSNERAWAVGYRAAKLLRDQISAGSNERLTSTAAIAEKFGSADFHPVRGLKDVRAFVTRNDEDVYIHLREGGGAPWVRENENFALARAIGDAVCFLDERRSVINGLHFAERQATGRAFAAEFLAPIEAILDMNDDGRDTNEISKSFGVSAQLIERQLENKDRIEQAQTA